MSGLGRKLKTLKRVVRDQGTDGIVSVLKDKLNVSRYIQPPIDYARLTPSVLSLVARHGRPKMFINAIGAGIGDDLLLTAMFRELRLRNEANFWIMNKYPELYRHNENVGVLLPPLNRYDKVLRRLGTHVVYPWYTSYNPAYDRDDPMPEQHIISVMCQKAGITGTIALRPDLSLTDSEKEQGRLAKRQVAIQSAGLDAKHAMTNKNWWFEGYQRVVSALESKYDFVQVGSRGDPLLSGALDMRGKTSLRGTAAILSGSMAFVGQVGLLMHLARSVDCRSVIVYGGRETPAQTGYPCNENLYSAVPCSPCWRLNSCPYDRMCLQMVSVEAVIEAIEVQVQQHGAPLVCDTATISQELIERNYRRHADAVREHNGGWSLLNQ